MKNFNQQWFDQNLVTGGKPSIERFNKVLSSFYDIIISVDSVYDRDLEFNTTMAGVKYHWFPMNECSSDMGINSIYAAMTILYNAEIEDRRVYLHCAVGVNRSPTVKECYHFMRTGKYTDDKVIKCDPDIQKMFIGHENETHYINRNKLLQNINDGFLPQKEKIEIFLWKMNHQLQENKVDLEALKQESGIS